MSIFEARYPGHCGVCDEPIRPGTLATYEDDEIAHAICPEPVALPDPCPRCFQIPASNGRCGCDD
ncbi:MAG TPA: hypothetical protein VFJ14_06780 [Nocardioidaceae bacterium]|nr:hypothetical protein [Nocardioidaceae bacterium]